MMDSYLIPIPTKLSENGEMLFENTSSNSYGIVDAERTGDVNVTLQMLNDEFARRSYPVIATMALCMAVGIFGNTLVCYVYTFQFRRSPANMFILTLAVFDLINCAVAIPFEIVDLLYPYMYGRSLEIPCKIFRTILTTSVAGSGLCLVCIAYERYIKICTPFNLFQRREAKFMIIGCIVGALCMGLPNLYVMGYHEEKTRVSWITGSDCAVADAVRGKSFFEVYEIILFITFLAFFTLYTYFYIRIGVTLCKRKHWKGVHKGQSFYKRVNRSGRVYSTSSTNSTVDNTLQNENACTKSLARNGPQQRSTRMSGGVQIRTTRLTLILFVVTVVCVLSFLPNIVCEILKFSLQNIQEEMKYDQLLDLVFEFCNKSYVLNSCVNPIIYSILNPPFRKECVQAVKHLMRLDINGRRKNSGDALQMTHRV